MNLAKKIISVTLMLALVLSAVIGFAEELPEPKRTIRIYVSASSSQGLKDTGIANMKLGDEITFELEQERDDGGFDPIGKGISDQSVIKFSSANGVNTVTALKGGTSVITFQNVIKVNPLKLGTAKLQLTFNVSYDPVESVTLDSETLSITKGKTKALAATVLPATADQSVAWTTSDATVAKVNSSGKITAVAPGTATITCATSDAAIFATCEVAVTPVNPDPESLTLSETQMYLLKGKSKKLAATVLPADAVKKVTWTTSDKTVAKVSSSGVVKGVGPGTATITCATVQGGLKETCEVTVFAQYADPQSLDLSEKTITLVKGKKQKLTAIVLPADANQKVVWSSSAKGIAKVSSAGVVTAVKPGTATITCKTKQGGLTAACEVTVTPKS